MQRSTTLPAFTTPAAARTLISSFDFRREQDEYGGTEAARKAGNYEVFVSPTFAYRGREYQVVLNGHWALAAAIADGVAPTVTEISSREDDSIGLLEDYDNPEAFLDAHWGGSDWHDAITGVAIF